MSGTAPPRAEPAGTLRLGPVAGAVRLPQLAAGPLPRFAACHAGACPRAVLSLWSQWSLLSLLPPVLAATLEDGRDLPLASQEVALLCAADGRPEALCLPHAGRAGCPGTAAERLLPLRALLDGLGTVLGAAGLPEPVLWGNAAAVLRWVATQAAVPSAQAVTTLLALPCWPDGAPNRLAGQLRPSRHPSAAGSVRRSCCLRLRLRGNPPCADCPCGAPSHPYPGPRRPVALDSPPCPVIRSRFPRTPPPRP